MLGAKNDQLIERIKEAADIVDVVGEVVALRRAGKYYSGLCPFHAEKTPSFYVDPERQFFHCFGCGAGGDVIKFVMQHRSLSFLEALEFLADRYNIKFDIGRSGAGSSHSETLLQYTEVAEEFYYQQLRYSPEGAIAREYLRKRQINDRIVEEQRLGYAPKSWDALVRYFKQKGLDLQKGVELGLFATASNRSVERLYDRFRNRLIFPIRNAKGQVVAFGGRTLEEGSSSEEPKYLNSPESYLYRKRAMLYQFHMAQEACRKGKRQVVLVEGYMDALAFHRVGFYRTVATLGTALTPQQARLIKRIADEVVLVYDGDEAGKKAMVRAFPVLAHEGLTATCIVLPNGMDPDDFFRHYSLEDFEELLNSRKDLGEFAVEEIAKTWDGSTPGKVKVLSELFPYLESTGQPILQAEYLKIAALRLGVAEEVIARQFKQWRSATRSKNASKAALPTDSVQHHFVKPAVSSKKHFSTSPPFSPMSFSGSLEEEILKIIVAFPGLLEHACKNNCWKLLVDNTMNEESDDSSAKPLSLIFRAIHEEWLEFSKDKCNKNSFCIDRIYDRLTDPKAHNVFSKMVFDCKNYDDEKTAFLLLNDYLGALEKQTIKALRARLVKELAEAEKKGDAEGIRLTLKKIQNLGGLKNRTINGTFDKVERGMVKENEHDFYQKT